MCECMCLRECESVGEGKSGCSMGKQNHSLCVRLFERVCVCVCVCVCVRVSLSRFKHNQTSKCKIKYTRTPRPQEGSGKYVNLLMFRPALSSIPGSGLLGMAIVLPYLHTRRCR